MPWGCVLHADAPKEKSTIMTPKLFPKKFKKMLDKNKKLCYNKDVKTKRESSLTQKERGVYYGKDKERNVYGN